MLFAVIKKELQGHLVSSRFWICSIILLVLAVLAAWVGTDDYLMRDKLYSDHEISQKEELKKIQVFSYLQPVLVRAPEPLSVLDRGFEGRLDDSVRISIYEIPVGPQEVHRGNEYLASFRSLDLTMLVRLVLGLLALLLTFDVVVGERGNGNLKLALAYGISRRCLLLGKILGALLALSGPLVLSVMLSVSILHFHGDVILGAVQWSRLVGLTVAYLAYLGIMLLLGILLSLYAHSSSAALVMSLLAWLLIVFLIPQSAVAIAAGLSGTGCDPQELAKSLKALREQQGRELEEATEAQQPLFDDTAHYSPVWEQEEKRVKMRLGSGLYYDARAEYYAVETKLGRLYAQRVYDQHRICAAVMERVERKANLLATLSPAFLLERLAAALAGTSVADYDAFFADCREYRMQLIKYLEELGAFSSWRWFTDETTPHPWTAMVGQPDPSKVSEEELGRLKARYVSGEVQAEVERLKILYDQDPTRHLNFEDLPKPERKVQSLSQALRRVRPEILCSLLFNIVFLGLVFRGFERYELG